MSGGYRHSFFDARRLKGMEYTRRGRNEGVSKGSGMVVRFAAEDGEGAVKLLGKEEAYHLVGEGHLRQGKHFIGAVVDCLREAVRAANDEYKAFAPRRHFLLQPL